MERNVQDILQQLRQLLASGDRQGFLSLLSQVHPADLAEVLEHMEPAEQGIVFGLLDRERAAMVLEELDSETVARLLRAAGRERAAKILDQIAVDELVDLLLEISPQDAREFLSVLEEEDREDIRDLLTYPEDSAGGLMTTDYVAVHEDLTAEEAIGVLRQIAPDAETAYYVYVVDTRGKLTGVLSLRELIIAPPDVRVKDIMRTNVIAVGVFEDQEEVARLVARYDLVAIPVVDQDGILRGIVTADDIMDVIEEEATEDIYRMAGAGAEKEERELASSPWHKARRRLPWLIFLLFGNMLSANVIQGFTRTIEAVVALAYFIPVLMDMGGNVGTQSFAVVVRGLATGELDPRYLFRTVLREAGVGVLVGGICGTLVGLVGLLWQGDPMLGLVVGVAMALTLFTATLWGTLVPLALERLGLDSALGAGPFITTVVDITGLLIYFTLATYLMGLVT